MIYISADKNGLKQISKENDVDGDVVYELDGIEVSHLRAINWLLNYSLYAPALVNIINFATSHKIIKEAREIPYDDLVSKSAPIFVAEIDSNGLVSIYDVEQHPKTDNILMFCYLSIDGYLEFMSLWHKQRLMEAACLLLNKARLKFLSGTQRDLEIICRD